MLPNPLHPAVVHLPIALAVLVPLFAGIAILVVRSGWIAPRVWVVVVLLQLLLVGFAKFAEETGEEQEERVERVVAERHIEHHEEAAERFLVLAAITLAASGAGLLGGRRGQIGRIATLVLSLVVLAAGTKVGSSGGELVYRHGAANAYLSAAAGGVNGGVGTDAASPDQNEDDSDK